MNDTDKVLSWPEVILAFTLAPFRVAYNIIKGGDRTLIAFLCVVIYLCILLIAIFQGL